MASVETRDPASDCTTRGTRRECVMLALVFLAACAILLVKRPDAILNPQFYVEDGRFWYAQANDLGPLRALFVPYRGYFVLAQRLGGALALAVPFALAPLVCNLVGTVFQALPGVFLISSRIAPWRPCWVRIATGFLYVAMPGTWTITASLTHSMWHLAPLAAMIVVARPARTVGWRVFDTSVLVLAGLTGPYAIFLAPIAAVNWWTRRERRDIWVASGLAVLAAIQITSLLVTPPPPEGRIPLGASAGWFARIVAQRVVYGALFGQKGTEAIVGDPSNPLGTPLAIGIASSLGILALAYAVVRGPRELRLFVVYACMAFGAALVWPAPSVPALWWGLLKHPGNGNRYFATAVFALLVTLVWLAAQRKTPLRIAGALGLATALVVGIRLDMREPPLRDYNFEEAVRRYKTAAPGERVSFVTPPGWEVTLTKRGDAEAVAGDDCSRAVRVDAVRLGEHDMVWYGDRGYATGGDPYVVFSIPDLGVVCRVRLTYELVTVGDAPTTLQVFWMKEGANSFAAEARNSATRVPSSKDVQTTEFRINDRIDRIRIDPDAPDARFRLLGIVLLFEPDGA